jgi:hypothetical protein
VVPEEAVVAVRGDFFVWVVDSGKVERRSVTLGVRVPGEAEITSGLAGTEQVVVGGLEMLQPGAPVSATVVERGKVVRKE